VYRLKLAQVLYKLEKYDEALIEAQQYTSEKPNDGVGVKILAKIFEKLKKFDDAIALLENYTLNAQSDAEALFMYARLQFLVGKLEEGKETLQKALKAGYSDTQSISELLDLKEIEAIKSELETMIQNSQSGKK